MNQEMLLAMVRHVLTFGSGFLVAKGYIKGEYADTLVTSLVGIAGVVWSLTNKMDGAKPQSGGPVTTPAAPAPAATSTMVKSFTLAALLLLGFTLASASPARAEGLKPPVVKEGSRIWSGITPEATASAAGSWYLTVLGSNLGTESFDSDLSQYRLGLGLGYLSKLGNLGVGFDFEASRHIDSEFEFENELDNWNWSGRGRVGYFISPTVMPYLSAGYARVFTEQTWTYGAGTELFLNEKTSIRVEVNGFEFDQDLIEMKTGISFRF